MQYQFIMYILYYIKINNLQKSLHGKAFGDFVEITV